MPALQLAIALGLILLNGCFVMMEFALVKMRGSRLELLVRQGDPRAALAQRMQQSLDVYLSAMQMGITMASLGLGWVGEPAMASLMKDALSSWPLFSAKIFTHGLSFALAFGLITFMHILLGELVPRAIGIQKAEAVLLWAARPVRFYYLVLKLPVTLMSNASIFVLRLLRMAPAAESESQMSEDELRILLGLSEERGGFSLERFLLMENIFDLDKVKVGEVMVPKDKVVSLSPFRPWEKNLALVRARRFSRYPLCDEELDSASGYVHIKDLLLRPGPAGAEPDLSSLKRELAVVSPNDSLQKLLQQFADKGIRMGLVKDAEGKALGVVTLEDMLEEIVGEIHDEYDIPQAWFLSDVLAPGAVEVGLEGLKPEAVIRRLMGRVQGACPSLPSEEAMRLVLEREAKLSSAVGHGVAIPHARLPGLERAWVAVGLTAKPVPMQAPDKTPVRLFFLILTPSAAPLLQLKILARVAYLCSNDNLRRRMLRAKTPERLLDILRAADTVLST